MTAAVGNNWLVLVLSTVALASAVILADKSSEFVKGKSKYIRPFYYSDVAYVITPVSRVGYEMRHFIKSHVAVMFVY
jgi:hypothetical protein